MSGSNDQLKSMFDEAFAAEQIAFDMGAWQKMEAMLNQRNRRRGLWIWLLGIGLATGLSSWLLLNDMDQSIYTPRTLAVSFDPDLTQSKCTNEPSVGSIASASVIQNETPVSNSATSQASPGASELRNNSVSNENNKWNNSQVAQSNSVASTTTLATDTDTYLPTLKAASVQAAQAIPIDSSDQIATVEDVHLKRQIDFLDLLPLANFKSYKAEQPEKKTNDPNPSRQHRLVVYARAGFSKTLFHKPFWIHPSLGQSGGLGLQYQFREHLLLSSEIGVARMMFNDTMQLVGATTYSYTSNENMYSVSTSELLYAEVPIMLHYRMNRLQLGAGLSAGYLLGLKTQTTHTISQTAGSGVIANQEGWFRWDRYRSIQTSLLADLRYQLSSGAIIGIRESFGLSDITNVDYKALRASRLEIYLKLHLK